MISSNLFFLFNLIPSCSWSVLLFEILKRGNFRCTDSSVGVETQLSNLALITQVIDPKLHQHLGIVFNSCLFTPYILVYYLCFILKCSCHFRPVTWASVWLLFLLAPSYDGPLKFMLQACHLEFVYDSIEEELSHPPIRTSGLLTFQKENSRTSLLDGLINGNLLMPSSPRKS